MKLNLKKIKKGQLIGNMIIISDQLFYKGHNLYVNAKCNTCNTEKEIRINSLFVSKKFHCKKCRLSNIKSNKVKSKREKSFVYKGILSSVYNKMKYKSEKREIPFQISIEYLGDLFEKQKGKCALTGLNITLKNFMLDSSATASLDRIKNYKGYLKNNVQWVHKDINFMKGAMSQEDFIFFCNKVRKQNKLK